MMAGLALGGSAAARRPCKREVTTGGDCKAAVVSGGDGTGSASSTWMRGHEKPCSSPSGLSSSQTSRGERVPHARQRFNQSF